VKKNNSATRFTPRTIATSALLLLWVGAAIAQSTPAKTTAPTATTAESIRLYLQLHAVLSHPRCVNCHPRDDTPRQGLDQHVHSPPITRGPQNLGPAGQPCATCHNDANFDPGRVPGAPHWRLAPLSMAWAGKSPGELCRAMTDPARNGNRNLQATVKHLTEDALVAWGWAPGIDPDGKPRAPVPVPKAEFNRIALAWSKSGGACPD
jgi:hypothetical protein